jgi:lipid II isoglutaminyl synthase (glutamine-hydrolysing)
MDLHIAHLYPDLMNIYGDRGNVIALSQRAKWRGIDVEVRPYSIGEWAEPDWPDVWFFGGGQASRS